MRFKVGDELIIVKDDGNYGKFGSVGTVFVVADITGMHYMDDSAKCVCEEDEVELLSVFNSSLYQALT